MADSIPLTPREHYSEEFPFNTAHKWDGNYSNLDNIIENNQVEELKIAINGGASYTHQVSVTEHKSCSLACPLTLASFNDNIGLLEVILKMHNPCDCSNEYHNVFLDQLGSAANLACENSSINVLQSLIEYGFNFDPRVHPHVAAKHGSWPTLRILYKHLGSAKVDDIDEIGHTALHWASQKGYAPTVRYLLEEQHADASLKNSKGNTALHLACLYASEEIVYILISNNSPINSFNNAGKTPLSIAAELGKHDLIHILSSAGAFLDSRDNEGNTPLILAASYGNHLSVRELVNAGAEINATNKNHQVALEKAILNKKDFAAAVLIKLDNTDKYKHSINDGEYINFLENYISSYCISFHDIVKFKMTESVRAFLDRMVIVETESSESNTRIRINTKYLYTTRDFKNPTNNDFDYDLPYFLQRIALIGDQELADHGTIKALVDIKMKQFGYINILLDFLLFIPYLTGLAYIIVLFSYHPIDAIFIPIQDNKTWYGIFAIISLIYVLLYLISNISTEVYRFFKFNRSAYIHIKDKKAFNYDCVKNAQKSVLRTFVSRINNMFFLRSIIDYSSNIFNVLDFLSINFLILYIILRIAMQPSQWIFSVFALLFNYLRLFEYIILLPNIGTYAIIFYRILTRDVPLFFGMFSLSLIIFSVCFFVSLRTPYTSEGFLFANVSQNTDRIEGITDEIWWVFLSSIRILMEGNIIETNYLNQHFNWLSSLFYLVFLFITVIVFVNVFIAQLSDTYSMVAKKAKVFFASNRLMYIIVTEKGSLLSLFVNLKKRYFIDKIYLNSSDFSNYFGFSSQELASFTWPNFSDKLNIPNLLFGLQLSHIKDVKLRQVYTRSLNYTLSQEMHNRSDKLEVEIDKKIKNVEKRILHEIENSLDKKLKLIEDKFQLIMNKLDAVHL